MRKYIVSLVALSTMLVAVSCNKVKELPDEPNNVGKLLIPTTKVLGEYKDKEDQGTAAPYKVEDFMVTISQYGEDGTTLTPVKDKKWKIKDMPSKVGLGVGKYAMQAASYEGKQLDVSDTPYFYGIQDFTIAIDENTSVDLNIAIQDAKMTLVPTDAFKQAFTDWSIKVVTKADETKQLFELNETTLDKYMKPTDVTLHMQATRRNSPVTWSQSITVSDVKVGDWIKPTFTIDPVGNVTVNIVVDNTLTEREIIIEIPNDDEDLGGGGIVTPDPDPEEPEEPEVPTFEKPSIVGLEGLNVDEILVVSKAAGAPPVKIKIDADNGGIQKLLVTIDSQEAWLMIAVKAMFDGQNNFDLANLIANSDTKKNLLMLGIIQEDTVIKGEKSFTFDITGFMSLLSVNNPATNSYDFTIAVEDKVGDSLQKKLVVQVQQ